MLRTQGSLRIRSYHEISGTSYGTPRTIRSLGAHHVILAQEIAGKPVHRAYITVHLDRRNRVYLIKNRAVPLPFLPPTERPFSLSRDRARARALRNVREGQRDAECRADEDHGGETERIPLQASPFRKSALEEPDPVATEDVPDLLVCQTSGR
jgi:hypothetical protein